MPWLDLACYVFGGAFLTNAIPHVVSGTMGRAFQSPFAKPPGKGLSSSTVNVLWGFANLILGYLLIWAITYLTQEWCNVYPIDSDAPIKPRPPLSCGATARASHS